MRTTLIFILFVFVPVICFASQATQVKEGNQLFKEKKWDEAIDQYFKALQEPRHEQIIHYDLGAAFYKKKDYDQAIEHLQKASVSKDQKLNSHIAYNLGNSFFQKGRLQEEKDLEAAIDFMKKSLGSYEKSLELNSKDEDALYNQRIVQEEIQRLEKKKQEQKSKEKNHKDQNKEQSKQDKKSAENKKDQNQDQNQDKREQKQEQSSSQEENPQESQKEKQESSNQDKGKDQKQDQADSKGQKPQDSLPSQEELLKKQAQAILEDYEREEAPTGLLNFMKYSKGDSNVSKDW